MDKYICFLWRKCYYMSLTHVLKHVRHTRKPFKHHLNFMNVRIFSISNV